VGPSLTFHRCWKSRITAVVTCILILAPHVGIAIADERDAILAAVHAYMIAIYARDYAEAYRWISEADRRLKSLGDYEQDNEPFKGPSLILAQRIAREIVMRDAVIERQGERAKVQAALSLPHGNADEISALLLTEGGHAEPPPEELGERMAKIEALIASGKLPKAEIDGEWMVVRDPGGWRVFLDWGSGVRIQFAIQLAEGLSVTASFDRTEVLTPRGEAVQLRLTVHNRGTDPVQLKVIHRVEPTAHEKQLDLVQCGYLFPRDLAGGEVDESPVVYFVDEDLPKDTAQLRVTLEFVPLE
jgi:hypothetical protein